MREETTTEALYAGLSPEARAEAVRLAARLQAEGGEAAHVVAAAREAGVEDRFLREAVARLGGEPERSQAAFPAVPAVVALLFFFAQGYAGAVTYGDVAGWNLWIPMFLAAAMGAALPRGRNRLLAPLCVAATWLIVTVFYLITSRLTGWHIPEMAYAYASRILLVEMALAFFGALVANALADARNRPSARA